MTGSRNGRAARTLGLKEGDLGYLFDVLALKTHNRRFDKHITPSTSIAVHPTHRENDRQNTCLSGRPLKR